MFPQAVTSPGPLVLQSPGPPTTEPPRHAVEPFILAFGVSVFGFPSVPQRLCPSAPFSEYFRLFQAVFLPSPRPSLPSVAAATRPSSPSTPRPLNPRSPDPLVPRSPFGPSSFAGICGHSRPFAPYFFSAARPILSPRRSPQATRTSSIHHSTFVIRHSTRSPNPSIPQSPPLSPAPLFPIPSIVSHLRPRALPRLKPQASSLSPHPFTAPMLNPPTKCFWATKNSTMHGSMVTMLAAIRKWASRKSP